MKVEKQEKAISDEMIEGLLKEGQRQRTSMGC